MGFALGQAAWERGADTVVISGPTSAPRPPGPRYVEVETAREMLTVLETELREARILLMAAAVGDFEAESVSPSKLRKSSGESLILALRRGPDLLLETSALRRERRIYTVGFALETADAIAHGREKRVRKGMDLIAINDANEPGAGFEVETNRVTLIDATGAEETLPLLPKREVAERILDRVEAALAG